jgi:hypothetical protein
MFLYFVEGWSGRSAPAELQYAFDKSVASREIVGAGPSGAAGMLLGRSDEGLAYHPDKQTWQKIPGSKCWVGMNTDDRPLPDSLARTRRFIKGHFVELGDGNSWQVPIARSIDVESQTLRYIDTLPMSVIMDESGQWVPGEIVPHFRRLWEIASWFFDRLTESNDGQLGIDPQIAFHRATEVLGHNYFVGPVELSMLGVWHSGGYASVLEALVDLPKLEEWASLHGAEKKSDEPASVT